MDKEPRKKTSEMAWCYLMKEEVKSSGKSVALATTDKRESYMQVEVHYGNWSLGERLL
jgi:hypothetical protein